MWDDEAGYSYDDPKHPSFYERYAMLADQLKKQRREHPIPAPLVDRDAGDESTYEDAA